MTIGIASIEEQYIADNIDNAWAGDKRLHVEFRMESVQHPEKSAKAGRPIFEEVEYIRITMPGERDNIPDYPVGEQERMRFKERYEAWKKRMGNGDESQPVSGTPISVWPKVTRKQVEELRYWNIHTVEQLRDMSDDKFTKMPGGRRLKQEAKDWLDFAEQGAQASALREEKERIDTELAVVRKQMADLQAINDRQGKQMETLLQKLAEK